MPDTPDRTNQRLNDLIAEVLTRGNMVTPEMVANLRIAMGRVEEKLDNTLAKLVDMELFRKDARDAIAKVEDKADALDKRIVSLEVALKVAVWVTGAAWALALAVLSALAYKVLNP
jgi:hypothetical protein